MGPPQRHRRHVAGKGALALLLSAALAPSPAQGQQVTGGIGLSGVVNGGEGVSRRCYQRNYLSGVGGQLATPLTGWANLQITGRGYWLDFGSTCETLFLSHPDGIYVEDDQVDLLARSFVTTDVRLAARLGAKSPLTLAVGGGNAWRRGFNMPYLLFAAGLILWDRPTFHVDLGGEFQWLRVSADRFRRTYQDSQVVTEEPLGRVHRGSHAVVIGLSLAGPLW